MTQTPHEKYPPEGKSLGHGPDNESKATVTYSTGTPGARKLWWRIRAAVGRPQRARRRTR
jgi:hypothetical protein